MTLSRDGNEFPYGSCEGQGKKELSDKRTGCGWIHVNEESHYIMPSAHLKYADLNFAGLRYANLQGANLRRVKANSRTICPNGITYGTAGHDCPF